jgi:chromosome segregation ATPase
MKEKQEKKRLEERIQLLQGQIMMGGAMNLSNLQDMPAFRNALKEHQERIRAEYEVRLADLEKERETIEEEKAQVDRYKQLLLKQRDIMILLTQRLNERDEQIMALQDELDAYDRHQRDLEEKLDEKTAALIHLQRVTMEHNAASPVKNTELVEALGDWAGSSPAVQGLLQAGRIAGSAIRNGGVFTPDMAIPAHLLVTTKQFKPFEDAETPATTPSAGYEQAVNSENVNASTSEDRASPTHQSMLLSAEEKIAELVKIVDNMRSEKERLARDLEDVQAEKVSMEYLLREKLEKLVQSEIEARLASYKKDSSAPTSTGAASMPGADVSAAADSVLASTAAMRHLQLELQSRTEVLATTRAEFVKLQEEIASLRLPGIKGEGDDPSKSLRERLAVHDKERKAIHTIMEHKIKTLVDNISALSQSLAADHSATASAGAHGKLLREVQALQRLVNASISALRNSELQPGTADGLDSKTTAGSTGGASLVTPAKTSAGTFLAPASSASVGRTVTAPSTPAFGGSSSTVDALIQQRKEELQRQRNGASALRK